MGLFKQANSPHYWMSFSVGKKQLRRTTGTEDLRTAKQIFEGLKAKIALNQWHPEMIEQQRYTFDEMMKKFMKEHAPQRAIKTQKSYITSLNNLSKYFKGMTLSEITPLSISDYYQRRKGEGMSISSINREFAMLSKAFNLAFKRWEWCKENPCQKVQKEPEHNSVDRWLTHVEAEKLILSCSGYLNGDMIDIVTTAINTGMRQGEILNLRWTEADIFRKVITVLESKTKTPRTIPINETVYQLLLQRSKVRSMTGYVFTTSTGTRHMVRNLIREFDKAVEKAGIENFTFHCLRHTAATWMIQSGVDIYTVSKILGHRDIRTTMRYAHHYPESLRHGVKAIENFIKSQTKIYVENATISG